MPVLYQTLFCYQTGLVIPYNLWLSTRSGRSCRKITNENRFYWSYDYAICPTNLMPWTISLGTPKLGSSTWVLHCAIPCWLPHLPSALAAVRSAEKSLLTSALQLNFNWKATLLGLRGRRKRVSPNVSDNFEIFEIYWTISESSINIDGLIIIIQANIVSGIITNFQSFAAV